MGKKKGGRKADNDDWEAELGETIPPANADPEAAAAPPASAPAADDDFGGGLMASVQAASNKKGKKNKKNNVDWDELEAEAAEITGEPTPAAESPAKEEPKSPSPAAAPPKAAEPEPAKEAEPEPPRVRILSRILSFCEIFLLYGISLTRLLRSF